MPQDSPADKATLAMRLDIIKAMIVAGKQQSDIVKECVAQHPEWNLSKRQLRNYCYAAKRSLAKAAPNIDLEAEFMVAKLRNDLLFSTAFEAKDNRTALSANVENIKLMQLASAKFKKQWAEKFASAGVDPDKAMNQFIAILKQEAGKNGDR